MARGGQASARGVDAHLSTAAEISRIATAMQETVVRGVAEVTKTEPTP